MKYTQNLNLSKPDLTDPVDIVVLNENMDKIDEEIGRLRLLLSSPMTSMDNVGDGKSK